MSPEELTEAAKRLAMWRTKPGDRVANDPLAASEAWKARAQASGAI